ncbi:hypothetical protein HMPREF9144_1221, partial [Prevotella pallens ATCC 700821]
MKYSTQSQFAINKNTLLSSRPYSNLFEEKQDYIFHILLKYI